MAALRGCVASQGQSVAKRVDFVVALETLAGSLAGRVVLDLGCGRAALWTRAYVARGARVVALELDAARVRDSHAQLAATPPAGPGRVLGVVRADGERIPLADATASLVHCAQVLEHVASPEAFLRELRRVLAPGGACYLTAINRFALRDPHFRVVVVHWLPARLADRIIGWLGATNPEGQALSAMHYFTRGGFARLCARSGLEVLEDLKRRERLARHGRVVGALADFWGRAARTTAFHLVVRRPVGT